MTSAPPAYKNVEESVGSQRERLVSFLKAEGLGEGEPNFKSTKLGTGERERFIAAVTVSGQQFKTYPKTYPSKVDCLNKVFIVTNPYHLNTGRSRGGSLFVGAGQTEGEGGAETFNFGRY